MVKDLRQIIDGLNSRQLRSVISGLQEVVQEKLDVVYKNDRESLTALRDLDEANANLMLQGMISVQTQDVSLQDKDLRELLLFLSDQEEFEPTVRRALDRRLLVSLPLDPVLMGSLLVFLLSIKWQFKLKRGKDGRIEYEIGASKEQTPSSLLNYLLGRIPGLGSVVGNKSA